MRRILLAVLAAFVTLVGPAHAETWPAHPITIVVPFAAGGPSDAMARILAEEHAAGEYACMMHCFSSSAALGRAALDLGFYLSMSGIATFPKSQDLRDIFAAAPLDRILVETDSPYLAPKPFRGKRNEPAYSIHTAETGAEIFGLSLKDFAAATQANFDRLFTKAAQYRAAA